MNLISKYTLIASCLFASIVSTAQTNKFSASGKVDLVSDYIFRGMDQNAGCSVQPSLTLGYGNINLNVWGSQTLSKWNKGKGNKEFDVNLSYNIKNLTITVSDFWWSGTNEPYGDYKNDHFFEGTLAYCINKKFPLTISWSTYFAGADKDENGDLRASTYINASYPLTLPYDVTLIPSIGFTPWDGMYWDKAALTDISLKASKDFIKNERMTLPLFVQVIVSPTYDRTYIVGGLSIGF